MRAVHYDSFTEARNHLKDVLDQAASGTAVTVRRDSVTAVVLDSERLRHYLASGVPPMAKVGAEADGWAAFIPGIPVAGAGGTYHAAVADMADALRRYAPDRRRLQYPPNHKD